MDRLSIRYLSSCDGEVTREAVDALAAEIRRGSPLEACLALDEYGEEDFLTVDVLGGWAALAYNTWDADGTAHLRQPVSRAFADPDEYAPVYIGGQTPVRKRNALDDLSLAADIVLYFAQTGGLSPETEWEEAE